MCSSFIQRVNYLDHIQIIIDFKYVVLFSVRSSYYVDLIRIIQVNQTFLKSPCQSFITMYSKYVLICKQHN